MSIVRILAAVVVCAIIGGQGGCVVNATNDEYFERYGFAEEGKPGRVSGFVLREDGTIVAAYVLVVPPSANAPTVSFTERGGVYSISIDGHIVRDKTTPEGLFVTNSIEEPTRYKMSFLNQQQLSMIRLAEKQASEGLP